MSTHTQQTETQKLISNLLDTLASWILGPKPHLPEKKIPSTQAKANILSAKDSELQNKEKPSIKLQTQTNIFITELSYLSTRQSCCLN
jgi:hypothetical protein